MAPPCKAIPFATAPIACSLTPKCKLCPEKSPSLISPWPSRCVLVEGAKSAEPPSNEGSPREIAFITWPEAERVAIGSEFSNMPVKPSSQPTGSLPCSESSSCWASSGNASLNSLKADSQSACLACPLSIAFFR